MKRKLILLVVTIVFLVGFGAILHSPPSMIDAVTGATPKSKKAAQASAQLEGSYVLGINMMSDGLDNENTRNTSYFPLTTLDSIIVLLYSFRSTEKPACFNLSQSFLA